MDKESHEDNNNNNNNNHTISGDFMAKRKRGRPRKHMKLEESNEQPLNLPPGFSHHNNEALVGQSVSGVIEATFDAGFLLSVRIGNSDNVLRGVVFKPGRCDPVSVDNDVAPHVPMISRRNGDHYGGSGRKSRYREKRGGRAMVPVPIQPAHPITIPSNLHVPVNVQNGGIPVHHGHQPFGMLLTQVMKNGPQVVEAESEEQALSIEPLQAIHPIHPVNIPKRMPSYGRGNMTQLLEAVQENVRETHFSQGQ